jgi:murein L,D-transpeptidase YafK
MFNRAVYSALAALCVVACVQLLSGCAAPVHQQPAISAKAATDLEAVVLPRLQPDFVRVNLVRPIRKLALLAFKQERRLEVWARDRQQRWRQLKIYPFTAYSGRLGPKLRQGDRQIPEGVYRIEYLNPNSKFHLSMKIDYPNIFDRTMARLDGRVDLGGDIFIHGKAATIGCIPIGDTNIEELFYLVQRVGRENVTVIIAPYDMRRGRSHPVKIRLGWEGELYRQIADSLRSYENVKTSKGNIISALDGSHADTPDQITLHHQDRDKYWQ